MDEQNPAPKKGKGRPATGRVKRSLFPFRMTPATRRKMLTVLWVYRQGEEGPEWSATRVLEEALEQYSKNLAVGFGGKLPYIPDADLENLLK